MKGVTPYLFISAITTLVLGAVATATNHQGFSLKIINLTFLLLFVSTFFYLKELKQK